MHEIPIPPLEMRAFVGPTDPAAFENPGGRPIYSELGISLDAYDAVFDFGCGCGRVARQLLLQDPRPRRYVGIDVNRDVVEWCRRSLSPVDPGFQFHHHDVYSPTAAPRNTLRLAERFPVEDGQFSLVIAHSVFTHLLRRQTEFYLHEVARILKPGGIAFTTWFFFDNLSFPFFQEGPFCLFAGETDPTHAVIYDRRWFLDAVRRRGLGVVSTRHPEVAGHQWTVLLGRRTVGMEDRFPLGEEDAEWLCGPAAKPMHGQERPEAFARQRVACLDSAAEESWPNPPALFGPLAELAAIRRLLPWRCVRAVLDPLRRIKRALS